MSWGTRMILLAVMVAACTSAPPPSASPSSTTSPTAPQVTGQPSLALPSVDPSATSSPSGSASPAPLESELMQPGALNVCLALVGAYAATSTDDGELVGYNVSFAREIAARLGLQLDFQHPLFEEVIDLVAGHECDVSVSSQNITASRLARIGMIPYSKSHQPVLVAIGNPANIDSLLALCGHAVSATAGTTHVDLVRGQGDYADEGLNEDCREAGEDPINLELYETELEAVDALIVGDVVAYLGNPGFVAAYPDSIDYAQTSLPPARQGIGVALDHPALLAAVDSALRAMVTDGTYRQILSEHLPNAESVDFVSIEE